MKNYNELDCASNSLRQDGLDERSLNLRSKDVQGSRRIPPEHAEARCRNYEMRRFLFCD